MTQLYVRKAITYVNDVKIEDLDVKFKVEKTLKKHPNQLDLSIYGLSDFAIGRIQTNLATVLLVAGYEDSAGQLFKGEARSILPQKEGADRLLRVQSGDGDAAYKYGKVSQSFAPGSGVSDVVTGIAKKGGIGIGNALEKLSGKGVQQYASGYSATGNVTDELDTVIQSAGFTWSIQDGELQLLEKNEKDNVTPPGQAEVISKDTGMIGSPEMGSPDRPNGPHLLKVKCLLRHQLVCGSIVEVRSRALRGQFRCDKVTHEGDRSGNDWVTTIEGPQI